MSTSRWSRIEELFHQVADLPPDQRSSFLDEACKDDEELRREVEALLEADNPEHSLLSAGIKDAIDLFDEFDETEPAGERIGLYAILELIGKGGMGTVYRGVREDDGAQVAIKLLRRGAETRAAVARFRRERRILAGLEHPNIARFLDGGMTEDGRPYLVMEYVEKGAPLLDYAAPLAVRQRLDLFRSICAAVQYAHERQIVHRDIKPGNILVAPDGTPKLLDFGIAKLLEPGARALTTVPLTGVNTRLMTPEYASPEQVRGEPVTPATDVYALGAVLYELLTGEPAQHLKTYSPEEIHVEICTHEPAKPSAVRNDLDPDLDNIVFKALRKEPGRRYESVEEFSADVGRFLEDLPVRARPESRIYWARKFARRNRAAVTTAVVSATLALAGVAGLNLIRDRGAPERSIAVLPFENLSGDSEQEYFVDGLTDALTDNLAQIENLRVISRTSSMTFKGTDRKLPDVARSLDVRTIAEGSIARAGSRIRLAIRLVNASEDRPMWSASYEGDMAEVLALQDQVTADVAREIGVTLSGEPKDRTARRRVDLGAYDAYLKGRHAYFSSFTQETLQKALRFFQQALERDPGYAPPYAGMADAYYMMSNMYYPPAEMMPKARAAAEKAIELDAAQAQAHATLALVKSLYEFDRRAADKGFRTAIELRPGDALVHLWYGLHLAGLGRFEESLAEVEHARKLDPISPATNAYIGLPLFLAGRYEEVIQRMQPITDAHPEYYHPYAWIALAYEQKGEYAKAVAAMERAYRADGQTESLAQLGHVYAAAGRTGEARKVLRQLKELSKRHYVPAYNIAMMHAGLGERDETFRWLQKAWEDRSEWFAWVGVDPRLAEYRSDPRFARVLRNAGLRP